jgi:hypothetical protein
MSYKLELPPKLSEFHDVFHISQLRKCLQTPDKPETFKEVDQDTIDLNHDLTYRERPIRILEKDVRLTRRQKINMYKVQWSNHTENEATCGNVKTIFSESFPSYSTLSYRILG